MKADCSLKADCLQCSGSGEERYPEEEDRIFPCYVCGGEGKVSDTHRADQDCERLARMMATDVVSDADRKAEESLSPEDLYEHLSQEDECIAESGMSAFDYWAENMRRRSDPIAAEIHSFLLTCPESIVRAMSFAHHAEVKVYQEKSMADLRKKMVPTWEPPKLQAPYNPNDPDDLPF